MRDIVLLLVMVFCLPLNAVSEEERKSFQFHDSGVTEKQGNAATGDSGFSKVIKKIKLPNYQSKTFGEAVGSYRYFSKREWKETPSSNGKVYVDFTGWLNNRPFNISMVSAQGVGIKFMVKSDGTYGVVMVSKVEFRTDGKLYSEPMPDISAVLNKLYGNVEIKF